MPQEVSTHLKTLLFLFIITYLLKTLSFTSSQNIHKVISS